MSVQCWHRFQTIVEKRWLPFDDVAQFDFLRTASGGLQHGPCCHQSGYDTIVEVALDRWRRTKNALWQETIIRTTLKDLELMERKRCRFILFLWVKCHFRQGRKMAPRRPCVAPWRPQDGNRIVSSAISFDDVAQTLVHRHTDTLVLWYIGAQIHLCTGTLVQRYSCMPVHRYIGTRLYTIRIH